MAIIFYAPTMWIYRVVNCLDTSRLLYILVKCWNLTIFSLAMTLANRSCDWIDPIAAPTPLQYSIPVLDQLI